MPVSMTNTDKEADKRFYRFCAVIAMISIHIVGFSIS